MHVPFALTAEQRTHLQHWLAKLGSSEWLSLETAERLDVQHLLTIIRANAHLFKATQAPNFIATVDHWIEEMAPEHSRVISYKQDACRGIKRLLTLLEPSRSGNHRPHQLIN
jgi:hypothetical protein